MNENPILAGETKTISLETETRFAPNGIVSRTVFQSDHARLVLFGFSQGQQLSEHSSTRHAIIQILTGSSDWSVDGKPQTLRAGDVLYMTPGTPHAVRAPEPFSMLLTLVNP